MTTRPRKLPLVIQAALAGLASLPAAMLEKLQEDMTLGLKPEANHGFSGNGRSRQASPHRVAHDKRAARRKRNRAMNRRFQHG